jgi:hypothetical protein
VSKCTTHPIQKQLLRVGMKGNIILFGQRELMKTRNWQSLMLQAVIQQSDFVSFKFFTANVMATVLSRTFL